MGNGIVVDEFKRPPSAGVTSDVIVVGRLIEDKRVRIYADIEACVSPPPPPPVHVDPMLFRKGFAAISKVAERQSMGEKRYVYGDERCHPAD